jgi:hypothetical protein
MIQDLLGGIELPDMITDLLEDQLGINLNAWSSMSPFEFADGNRAAFVNGLVRLLSPLNSLVKFLLISEDIMLFDGTLGASGYEGYANGIIPLLEAFGASGILTPVQYKAAIARNEDAVWTAILNPLLDVVDGLLADPLNGIFDVVPNLLFFVDNGGLEASLNNILHAAYVLLDTLRPLYPLDIFELLGINLGEFLSMDGLLNLVLDLLEDSLGVSIILPNLNSMMVGNVVSFTSRNGQTAYRLQGGSSEDLVTVFLRLLFDLLFEGDNMNAVLDLLSELVDFDADFIRQAGAILQSLYEAFLVDGNSDLVLHNLLNMFRAIGAFTTGVQNVLDEINRNWVAILDTMRDSDIQLVNDFVDWLTDFLDNNFNDIFDSSGLAPNGIIPFFEAIIAWVTNIWEWLMRPFNWIMGLFS